jgi:FkbM family methyltransferase
MHKALANTSMIARALCWYARKPDHRHKLRILQLLVWLFVKDRIIVDADCGRMALLLDDFIQFMIFRDGCYERETLDLILRLLSNGGCLVDVGANVGQFSIALARKSNGFNRVIAIEPNPQICAQLLENRRLNNLERQIEIVCAAVTRERRLVEFGVPPPQNLGMSREALPSDTDKFRTVGLPLGELLTDMGVVSVEVLKIDVEGAEWGVIQGFFLNSNRRPPNNIVFEYIPDSFNYGTTPNDVLTFLNQLGYELFTVHGEKFLDARNLPESNIWARMNR